MCQQFSAEEIEGASGPGGECLVVYCGSWALGCLVEGASRRLCVGRLVGGASRRLCFAGREARRGEGSDSAVLAPVWDSCPGSTTHRCVRRTSNRRTSSWTSSSNRRTPSRKPYRRRSDGTHSRPVREIALARYERSCIFFCSSMPSSHKVLEILSCECFADGCCRFSTQ